MRSSDTITLTWHKHEMEMMVLCMSRHFPKSLLLISSVNQIYCCPACSCPVNVAAEYCSACGQCIDWGKPLSLNHVVS